jgi:hypothetical protein
MDYITIEKPEFDELLKIKLKYESLMKKSVLSLSGTSIYCKICNTVSKDNNNVKNHVFKEEL